MRIQAFCMKFFSTPDTSVEQCVSTPTSKSTISYCFTPFFKEYLNPQAKISKMAPTTTGT